MPIQNMFAALKVQALAQLANFNAATVVVSGDVLVVRRRFTLAEVNAGAVLLPPIFGIKYRLTDARMISIGGAFTTSTLVRITGTQAAAVVALLGVAIAALSQSAVVRAGAANATVLADGASFIECDVQTGINVDKTGGAGTVATAVDVEASFVLVEG